MKTLVISGHNDLSVSKISKAWLAELVANHPEVTVHKLCEEHKGFNFDVAKEQQLLLAYDRIVFMFPIHWCSVPSLLQRWLEQVVAYGFAYGPNGENMKGKEMILVASTGLPAEAYSGEGAKGRSLDEIMFAMKDTAKFVGMSYAPMYALYGIMGLDDAAVEASAKAVAKHITG